MSRVLRAGRNGHDGLHLMLHCWWQVTFAGVGLVAMVVACWMTLWPPSRVRIDKGPKGETLRTTTTQTESTTFALGLLCVGGIAVFMAANGLKLAKVSRDGFEIVGIQEEAAEQRQSADNNNMSQFTADADLQGSVPSDYPITRIDDFNVYSADAIPIQVLADLRSALLGSQSGASLSYPADVKYGQRSRGQGNHPWYVTLRTGGTFKLSYGGRGRTDATVTSPTSGS